MTSLQLKKLNNTFKVYSVLNLGHPRYFSGIEFPYNKDGVSLFQRKHVINLLEEISLLNANRSTLEDQFMIVPTILISSIQFSKPCYKV